MRSNELHEIRGEMCKLKTSFIDVSECKSREKRF